MTFFLQVSHSSLHVSVTLPELLLEGRQRDGFGNCALVCRRSHFCLRVDTVGTSLPFSALIYCLYRDGRSKGLCPLTWVELGSVWQCKVSHCADVNRYRPAPRPAETLSSIYPPVECAVLFHSGLRATWQGHRALSQRAARCVFPKHPAQDSHWVGSAQWMIPAWCSTAPQTPNHRPKRSQGGSLANREARGCAISVGSWQTGTSVTNMSLCRSSCGSRTWSSSTWIYSASGATWPACRAESCPTPSASWPLRLAPPSWQWVDLASSQSHPSMHW